MNQTFHINAAQAIARIAALEIKQHRPLRELQLDSNSAEARSRLAAIDAEIATLRAVVAGGF